MEATITGERFWVASSTLRKKYVRPRGRLKEGMIVYRDNKVYELFLHDFVNDRWYLEVKE
jgi:hypothetical protein